MERTMKRTAAAAAAAVALLAGGGVLAGCGSSTTDTAASTAAADAAAQPPNGVGTLPATEILAKSQAATKAATSVTVKGTMSEGGQDTSLDLVLGADSGEGTITTNGTAMNIKSVGGKNYFQVPGNGWATLLGAAGGPGEEAGKEIAALVGDKWLVLPANAASLDEDAGLVGLALSTIGMFIEKDPFFKDFIFSAERTFTVSGTGDVNGTPVVFLKDTSDGAVMAIQTVGEPYPVQIKAEAASDSSTMTFSNWNAPVSVTAPTEVIDVSKLATVGDTSASGQTTN